MPASLIEDENSMSAGADPGGDLVQMQLQTGNAWWAREDSNLQPDRYERSALTIELRARPQPCHLVSMPPG